MSIRPLQDRLSALMGCEPDERANVVTNMLRRSPREATAFWLQLLVSVGIATLGLVLDSTAVVIGAMLIAPLMMPIVGLGMGLAVGSPFLVLRSGTRIAASVAAAIGASAVMIRLLPFNEMNAELAARTTPTVLDLLIATFCAIAGVYASMRPSSDLASAAAGTSIGIALVPPLCTSGYGLGTASWGVAGGAALLFLTNFVAIVVVSTFMFAAVGFNRVPVRDLEADEINARDAPRARKLARQLERLFASRSGPWLRLFMPLVLLALVYAPLRQALDEVAWQIRNRAAVQGAISDLELELVRARVLVERGKIDVALVVLGTTTQAQLARSRLETVLETETGTKPTVAITAVPDARAFAGLEAELRKPAPVVPAVKSAPFADALRGLESAVRERWPVGSTGRPLSVTAQLRGESAQVTVVYVGDPLSDDAREMLDRALQKELGIPTKTIAGALPRTTLVYTEGALAPFLASVSRWMQHAQGVSDVWICLEQPEESDAGRSAMSPDVQQAVTLTRDLVSGHPRAVLSPSDRLSIRFSAQPCKTEVAAAEKTNPSP